MRPRSSSCSGGEYRIATGIIHTPWFASWRLRRRTTSRHEPTLEGHHAESTESLAEMSLPQHSCHCRRHVACRMSHLTSCDMSRRTDDGREAKAMEQGLDGFARLCQTCLIS
jgi:hypothetical protein